MATIPEWKKSASAHREMIMDHLKSSFGFPEVNTSANSTVEETYGKHKNGFWNADTAAYKLVQALEEQAHKQQTDGQNPDKLIVPKGWTTEDTEYAAEVAYNLARIGKHLGAKSFDAIVDKYAHAVATSTAPLFDDKLQDFLNSKFALQDGQSITGTLLWKEVKNALPDAHDVHANAAPVTAEGENAANHWKKDEAEHSNTILKLLQQQYKFPLPDRSQMSDRQIRGSRMNEYWNAYAVAETLSHALAQQAFRSGVENKVPAGWTLENTKEHADVAFAIAGAARALGLKSVHNAVDAYAQLVASSTGPDFDTMVHNMDNIKFAAQNDKEVAGSLLMEEARKLIPPIQRKL